MNYEAAINAVDDLLLEVVNSDVDVLRDASRHILAAGGKRVRPRLALLAYEAVGGKDFREILPVAAAVELVHTATLVHDDINDHGAVRRGRATVNAKWGRTFALLTGDYLFTKVYELAAPYAPLNPVFAEITVALVEGETLQAQAAKEGKLDRETYARVIAKKTASLFGGAAKMGAMVGNGTPEQIEVLSNYGFNIGMAFQIVDDILDLVADSKTLGKTAGIDAQQGKGFMVAAAVANGNGSHSTATATVDIDENDPMAAFKRKMLSGNYIQEGRENANQFAQLATMSLDVLPASAARDELQALANQVVDR